MSLPGPLGKVFRFFVSAQDSLRAEIATRSRKSVGILWHNLPSTAFTVNQSATPSKNLASIVGKQ